MRHRLIIASLLFQFLVVCTMTIEGLPEGEITPGRAKYPPQVQSECAQKTESSAVT